MRSETKKDLKIRIKGVKKKLKIDELNASEIRSIKHNLERLGRRLNER